MNLIEAIKSGKPFRRSGWDNRVWIRVQHESDKMIARYLPHPNEYPSNTWRCFDPEEVLADDWVLEEPTVTISASQFWQVVNSMSWTADGSWKLCDLARKLGLEG